MSSIKAKRTLAPLGMKCTQTDCEHGLHYFKPTKKHPLGTCRRCGAAPIDWARLHRRDIADVAHTVKALHNEHIRHQMWQVQIDDCALEKAWAVGPTGLRQAIAKRMHSKCIAGKPHPVFDGRQTPRSGDVIYYAQHATATCCRKCMAYWHDIPFERELTHKEVDYITALIMFYIRQRLPSLLDDSQHDTGTANK